jgi:hypothetical protein
MWLVDKENSDADRGAARVKPRKAVRTQLENSTEARQQTSQSRQENVMYDGTITFEDGNTRHHACDFEIGIIVWAARYGIALHYRSTCEPLRFTVTAAASCVRDLGIYDGTVRCGIYTKGQ